jgi:predicted nuclease with TOPRIM domain
MSITARIPALKGHGRHRAADKLAELREDNRKLLDRQMAADDFFACLMQDRADLQTALEQERERRQIAEKERDQAEEVIRLRDREIADLKRRRAVRVLAEAAAAETQPIPVVTRVMPLHEAPFATTDPGRIAQ